MTTPDLRRVAQAAGAAALLGILAACSSSTDTPAATSTPSPAASSTSTATSTAAAKVSFAEALAAAGAQCSPGAKGQDCTLDGVKLTLSPGTWASDTAQRQRACTEGYVNSTYKVVTDGRDMITTDLNKDNATIVAALREHGADARETNYCP
ncbi:hypothetical protein TPB0596_11850 [Tsukamurella pulmonis]|uniref:hypothetical protein n=1 Tax=Tsukamurella pulmonis TaxID=47312 RepID=UPI001EE01542|nr:hypothetical protein [Tsukamurella pulmonis]BDD81422.1 hypothetical protein TPB0596_11850 [Tsukamurella pulmonis]